MNGTWTLAAGRHEEILRRLAEHGSVSTRTLSDELGVSVDTVQRDIRHLESDGRVRRVRGGALPRSPGPVRFLDRVERDAAAKDRIAAVVATLIDDHAVVALGGGTTVAAVARALGTGPRTVVTTAPDVALVAGGIEGTQVVLPGGRLEMESRTLVGADAVAGLRRCRPDVAVVSACSLDPDAGVTMRGREEAEATRAMVDAADVVVVAVTATKLGTAAPWVAADLPCVSILVSDASADAFAPYAARGLDVREA
jgi:DeoR/GlpR family transcriptional regulator of sugar metabolism